MCHTCTANVEEDNDADEEGEDDNEQAHLFQKVMAASFQPSTSLYLVNSWSYLLQRLSFSPSFSFFLCLNAKASERCYSDLCPVISNPGISPHPPLLPYSSPFPSSLSHISFLLKGHGNAHKLKWGFRGDHCHFLPNTDALCFPSLVIIHLLACRGPDSGLRLSTDLVEGPNFFTCCNCTCLFFNFMK